MQGTPLDSVDVTVRKVMLRDVPHPRKLEDVVQKAALLSTSPDISWTRQK